MDGTDGNELVVGSVVFEEIRRRAFEKSIAINCKVAPTDVETAIVAHKAELLRPRNPDMLINQMYASGFTPLMETIWGQMAKELEAPERMLTQFPDKVADKRLKFLEYRQHKNKMLCCDRLDDRNPRFHALNDAIYDQAAYEIARTNTSYGITEREYQATDFTNNKSSIEERQTVVTPPREKGGLLSKINIFK